MGPQSYQTIQTVYMFDSFIDSKFPAGQFTRGIDIMGLDLCREFFLIRHVDIDLGFGERVRVASDIGDFLEHSSVECAEN